MNNSTEKENILEISFRFKTHIVDNIADKPNLKPIKLLETKLILRLMYILIFDDHTFVIFC